MGMYQLHLEGFSIWNFYLIQTPADKSHVHVAHVVSCICYCISHLLLKSFPACIQPSLLPICTMQNGTVKVPFSPFQQNNKVYSFRFTIHSFKLSAQSQQQARYACEMLEEVYITHAMKLRYSLSMCQQGSIILLMYATVKIPLII